MDKKNLIASHLVHSKNLPNSKNYSLIRNLKDQPIQIQQQVISILESHKKYQITDYFKTEPNIIFNHKPEGPKSDKNKNLIPYSFVGPVNIFYSNNTNNNKRYLSTNKFNRIDVNQSLNSSRRCSCRNQQKFTSKKNSDENRDSQIHFLNSTSLSNVYNAIKNRINNNMKNNEELNNSNDY